MIKKKMITKTMTRPERQQASQIRGPHRHGVHRHRAVVTHALGQRKGIPYELELRVCATCGEELEVKPLKRAAA